MTGVVVTAFQRGVDNGLTTLEVRRNDTGAALLETHVVRTWQVLTRRARLLERLSEEYPVVIGLPLPELIHTRRVA